MPRIGRLMRIDVHAHVCARSPERGQMSARLYRSLPFRFMRWRLGIEGDDPHVDPILERTLADPVARTKLVHGSDWPILPVPPAMTTSWPAARTMMRKRNWLRRDVLIKETFDGWDDAYG